MKLGVNNNYRTRIIWRKRTPVKLSMRVPYVRPAEADLLNNLHAKINVSHIGIHAMDRFDVVHRYDWLIGCRERHIRWREFADRTLECERHIAVGM
jgi:hypothetical protein